VRRRILLLVVGMTALVVLAFAIPVAILTHQAVAQRADRETTDQAESVALYLGTGTASTGTITRYLARVSSSTGRPTAVQLPNGSVIGAKIPQIGGDQGGPDSDLLGPGGGHGPGGELPHAELHPAPGGQVAEAVTANASGAYLVQVFLSDDARYAGEGRWWLLIGLGSLGLLLIGAGAGELITRRIVRPLELTTETAGRLAAGDVTARAPIDGPREVAEVGVALNRLADRIDELIAEERETVADLSHRLRTPLTALRLDTESLRDPADAELIGNHVSALERMLTAVIRAARRPQREGRMPACDARAVVAERVAFWSALAEDQRRSTTVTLPIDALPVRAAAEDLAAAVDALLENVIAHTPEGTAFEVTLGADPADPGGATLTIADDGPGIPADAVERGRSDRGSSGLGLDIARRCAEAGGGSMEIGRTPSGGALVTLHLRAP
jgi:signal transduction histidine kinase